MKKILIFFMLICFIGFNDVKADSISAKSYLIYDVTNETLLEKYNEEELVNPGIFSALVTVSLGKESLKGNELLKTTIDAADNTNSNYLGLKYNEKMSFNDLMKASLLTGAADALNVIAQNTSSDELKFYTLMNNKLIANGAKNSYFDNVYGESDSNSKTTAIDMLGLFKKVFNDSDIVEILKSNEMTLAETDKKGERVVYNNFDKNKVGSFEFGMLDLYNDHNLVAYFHQNNIKLIFVIMGNGSIDEAYSNLNNLSGIIKEHFKEIKLNEYLNDLSIDYNQGDLKGKTIKYNYIGEDVVYLSEGENLSHNISFIQDEEKNIDKVIANIYIDSTQIKEVDLEYEINNTIIDRSVRVRGYLILFGMVVVLAAVLSFDLFKNKSN